jgi:hypothetical protein
MAPVTQRCGPLHRCPSSSSVQRDLASDGAASRWLPGGGSLGSCGAVVHGEEVTVDPLLKRVRMPSSTAVLVGVIFIIGGGGGGVSRSIVSGGNLRSRGGHH